MDIRNRPTYRGKYPLGPPPLTAYRNSALMREKRILEKEATMSKLLLLKYQDWALALTTHA